MFEFITFKQDLRASCILICFPPLSGVFVASIPGNEFIYIKSLSKSCLVGQENKYSDVRYMLIEQV